MTGGLVIRDADGVFKVAGVNKFLGDWQPKLAEAVAAEMGLQAAKRYNYIHVILESDCLDLVKRVNALGDEKTELRFSAGISGGL